MALLQLLARSPPRQRKAILCSASNDLILAITEIALNTLKGSIPLTPRQVSVLRKRRNFIKKLSSTRISLRRKKHFLKQSGGFLGPLLSIALPLITGLLTRS